MKFQTNYTPKIVQFEPNDGELITVPDQALTPSEILLRFASGRGSSVPQFRTEFDDYPDFKNLTIEELQMEREQLSARVSTLESEIKNFQFEQQKAKDLLKISQKLGKHNKQKPNTSDDNPDEN